MSSSWNEISSRQKRVNSKRYFTIDGDDFVPVRVSSRDEISRVNTLSIKSKCAQKYFPNHGGMYVILLLIKLSTELYILFLERVYQGHF